MKGSDVTVTKGTRQGRADQLGSTPRTIIVRCPCGRRNYFDRKGWSWLEVAFCVRCWQAILYHDLRVVSRWEGERMLREDLVFAGELKALRAIEGDMRRFLIQFRAEPLWTWPPQVVQMAQSVAANLQLVEQARTRQGVAPPVPLEQLPADIEPEDIER